jgi:hypothetical protein
MLRIYGTQQKSNLRNGDGGGDAAELRSAWTGETPVPTRAFRTFGAVMGVTVFCEIRIPVPGLGGRELMMEMRPELERLLQ